MPHHKPSTSHLELTSSRPSNSVRTTMSGELYFVTGLCVVVCGFFAFMAYDIKYRVQPKRSKELFMLNPRRSGSK